MSADELISQSAKDLDLATEALREIRVRLTDALSAQDAIIAALRKGLGNETIQTLLDLLNPLHGALDRQTYDDKKKENFDVPADHEFNVDITARMERDLTQAVIILENINSIRTGIIE